MFEDISPAFFTRPAGGIDFEAVLCIKFKHWQIGAVVVGDDR